MLDEFRSGQVGPLPTLVVDSTAADRVGALAACYVHICAFSPGFRSVPQRRDQIAPRRLSTPRGHTRRSRRSERMALSYPRTLFAYFLLFAALYAGFGVQSPYLPRLLQEHGLRAETIGVVLAAGTAIRLRSEERRVGKGCRARCSGGV